LHPAQSEKISDAAVEGRNWDSVEECTSPTEVNSSLSVSATTSTGLCDGVDVFTSSKGGVEKSIELVIEMIEFDGERLGVDKVERLPEKRVEGEPSRDGPVEKGENEDGTLLSSSHQLDGSSVRSHVKGFGASGWRSKPWIIGGGVDEKKDVARTEGCGLRPSMRDEVDRARPAC